MKNWAVFLPATFINLAYLPNELRVLFLNSVFFFWRVVVTDADAATTPHIITDPRDTHITGVTEWTDSHDVTHHRMDRSPRPAKRPSRPPPSRDRRTGPAVLFPPATGETVQPSSPSRDRRNGPALP